MYCEPVCVHGISFSQSCAACNRVIDYSSRILGSSLVAPNPYHYKCPRCYGEFTYWETYGDTEKKQGCPFCGLCKGEWGQDKGIEELRMALFRLLENTQHAEHECGDPNCPVKQARELVKQYRP